MTDHSGDYQPPSNNFHAVVQDAGGGMVDLLVDRDTFAYPPIGAGVWVVLDDPQWNLEGGAFRLLARLIEDRDRLRAALWDILNVEPVEAILDPTRPLRIAEVALGEAVQSGSEAQS